MKIKIKKGIYLGLWALTGFLIAILLTAALTLIVAWVYPTADLLTYQLAVGTVMIVIGTVGGLSIGPIAWEKIYIKGARGEKYLVNKKK